MAIPSRLPEKETEVTSSESNNLFWLSSQGHRGGIKTSMKAKVVEIEARGMRATSLISHTFPPAHKGHLMQGRRKHCVL